MIPHICYQLSQGEQALRYQALEARNTVLTDELLSMSHEADVENAEVQELVDQTDNMTAQQSSHLHSTMGDPGTRL
jgi:hypothetical protein